MQPIVVTALVPPAPDVRELVESDVLLVSAPDDLPGILPRLVRRAQHILLLGEKRHEPLVRRQAALLSDAGHHVCWRAVHHGPAAIALLANQVATTGVDAGVAVVLLDRLVEQTWSGAWTPSVAKLEHPSVNMGDHLRSFMPGGAGFVVTFSGPLPEARPVAKVSPAEPVLPRGELYGAGTSRLPDAARAALLTVSGSAAVVETPSLALDTEGRTGSSQAVELVALPAERRLDLPPARGRCTVCDALVFAETCPFCHVRPAVVDPRGALA